MVPDEVGVRHVGELLAVLIGELQRRSDFVRDEVIHEAGARGTRVSQPHDLYRCRSQCEYLVPSALRVAVHVHQNVNTVRVDAIGGLAIACNLRQVDEVLSLARDLRTEGRAVVVAERVTEYLDALAVVQARDRLHQMASRVIAEIRRDITNLQPCANRTWVLVRLFVKNVNLQ